MKIAVFGGTFDPPHKGHTELCRKILNEGRYGIDKIIVMPCGDPPHKTAVTSARHRLAMCEAAFDGLRAEVSGYEINEKGKSYTFRTLEHIRDIYGVKPYCIVGGDSMKDIRFWKRPEAIAAACEIIAVPRAGIGGTEKAADDFRKEYGAAVYVPDFTVPDVSATEIRILNSFGIDITGYTGDRVAAYIKENGLCAEYKPYADILRPIMDADRFVHSAHTAVTAYKLAKAYGLDAGKAVVAGLVHDCAKEVPESVLKSVYGIDVPKEVAAMHPNIRHAPLGALLAAKLFNIRDPEIISAVRHHTVGNGNMTPLEKLIFVADYIEPTRGYPDTPAMYGLAFRDIDEAAEAKYAEIDRKRVTANTSADTGYA